MLRYLPAFAMAFSFPFATPVAAQGEVGVCASLASQWDLIEQNLASSFVTGISDNSAPRATNRSLDELQGFTKASLLYEMMKDNKCPLPKSPPRAGTYLGAALKCEEDRMSVRSPDSCKRENWNKSE